MQYEPDDLDIICEYVKENLISILYSLNNRDEIDQFLHLIMAEHLLKEGIDYISHPKGDIVVVGALSGKNKNHCNKVAKNLGISEERLKYYPEYDKIVHINLDQLRNASIVFVGPTPHKTETTGDTNSLIDRLKQEMPGRIIELKSKGDELKITITSFKEALKNAIETCKISKDI